MNTPKQDSIIDRVGGENWQMVIEKFSGKTIQQIKEFLADLWPAEDTDGLAADIYSELN